MTTQKKVIIGVVVLAIIGIAYYFYNKNQAQPTVTVPVIKP